GRSAERDGLSARRAAMSQPALPAPTTTTSTSAIASPTPSPEDAGPAPTPRPVRRSCHRDLGVGTREVGSGGGVATRPAWSWLRAAPLRPVRSPYLRRRLTGRNGTTGFGDL